MATLLLPFVIPDIPRSSLLQADEYPGGINFSKSIDKPEKYCIINLLGQFGKPHKIDLECDRI